jgi:SAM-dependent methyltransferase
MKKNIPKKYVKLFEKTKSIRLDIGCGIFKQKGCLGMDIVKHPNVDIVHDVQKFPWPVPDDICTFVLMSHIFEHIEPKYRFQVMDECWRICRHDGQLYIACPYAGSPLEAAHPAHYMCPNESAFEFFDPEYQLWHSCSYKKPLPWKIVHRNSSVGGTIEVVLEPRKDKRGRALKSPEAATKYGSVQLLTRKLEDEVKWPKRKKKKKK